MRGWIDVDTLRVCGQFDDALCMHSWSLTPLPSQLAVIGIWDVFIDAGRDSTSHGWYVSSARLPFRSLIAESGLRR
jgi:hypothetical protein